MNAKIKELAEESSMTQYVSPDNKFLERFAQLILEECIDIIKSTKYHHIVYPNFDKIIQQYGKLFSKN